MVPMINERYIIEMNPRTKLPYSKYEHDAGEFFTDFLDILSQESNEVAHSFSLTLREVYGQCLE